MLQALQQLYLTCMIEIVRSDAADQTAIAELAAGWCASQIARGQQRDGSAKCAV